MKIVLRCEHFDRPFGCRHATMFGHSKHNQIQINHPRSSNVTAIICPAMWDSLHSYLIHPERYLLRRWAQAIRHWKQEQL
jgi:hypothetical protein